MRQGRWMRGEVRVMVATNAFGMGIDSVTGLHGTHMEASYEELDVKVIRAIQPLSFSDSEEVADLIIYISDVFLLGEGILQAPM